MGANQRKAILMLIHGVNGNLPAVHPVAEIALNSILSAVQIGMAVLAISADIGEDRIYVALFAAHIDMHAAQGIPGFSVIKFGLGANRPKR